MNLQPVNTPAIFVKIRADQMQIGDRVSRKNYLRKVVAVVHLPNLNGVGLTIDRGFGEVVTEVYPPDAMVEMLAE